MAQLWVAPAWQTPSPAHAPQLLHVPFMHDRDCVPQRPHDCVAAPEHDVAMGPLEEGAGCGATVVTEDQRPQGVMLGSCVVQALLTTISAPCAAAAVHAARGSWICEPPSVQPVSVTQHAVTPQMPALPAGSWSATLTVAGAVPEGNVTVHAVVSTTAGIADAKHDTTSKHPVGAPPSSPPDARLAEPSAASEPASDAGVAVGTDEGGTTFVVQSPSTQVSPSGQVDATPPSASPWAVPTQR
jgi:hypothetical protein